MQATGKKLPVSCFVASSERNNALKKANGECRNIPINIREIVLSGNSVLIIFLIVM